MPIKTTILLFFLSLSALQAQLGQGSWMVNGFINQYSESYTAELQDGFRIAIVPEVAVMALDKLMVGGSLLMQLNVIGEGTARLGTTEQAVFAKHLFRKSEKWNFFYGGKVAFRKTTRKYTNSSSSSRRYITPILELGTYLFLDKNLAIEAGLSYRLFSVEKFDVANRTRFGNGALNFGGRLQFFIHPQEKSHTEEKKDHRFYRGDWLVGGTFNINEGLNLRPQVLRFILNGLAVGSGFTIEFESNRSAFLGIQPMVRQYFFNQKKLKLFLDVSGGISGVYRNEEVANDSYKWKAVQKNISLRSAFGLSNRVSQNFSIDSFLFYNWIDVDGDFISTSGKQIGLGVVFNGVVRGKR